MSETTAAQRVATLENLVGTEYVKGHGTGNDFVLIKDVTGDLLITPQEVEALCDRHLGIGGDGLIRAVPSSQIWDGKDILEADPSAEWFMDYRNSDGSIAEMCGNGVRVFVHFLRVEGLVQLEIGEKLSIGTRGGVKVVTRTGDGYAVDMGPWDFIFPEEAKERAIDSLVTTRDLPGERPALSITMGNPHTVLALQSEAELENLDLSVAPTVQPLPPHGTNVEFVVPAEPLVEGGLGRISMRVHERGVGETQSCGTGACAAAAAIRYWAGENAPRLWRVGVPGGEVGVEFLGDSGNGEHVILSGPAVLVSRGTVVLPG